MPARKSVPTPAQPDAKTPTKPRKPAAKRTPASKAGKGGKAGKAGSDPSGNVSTSKGKQDGLTGIEQRFVLEYLKDFNGLKAYQRVRPDVAASTAGTTAWQLLKKPEVQAAIQASRARIVEKMELTSERVLREVARLAFFDPRKLLDDKGNPLPLNQLDDDTAAAIAGLEVQQIELGSGENALPAVIKKYKLSDKKGALDMAMRHLGEYEKHNKQLTDPLLELLNGMKGSTLPVKAEDQP